ncbi:protein LYK2-like [Rhododendron vialii]|uniref:protein LYK2-like n=1 Tax=Rhododendron vialii TaxID=182163 RepID=UPI00265FB249|nr:protein LYK2-like [Rhododendron vialii]
MWEIWVYVVGGGLLFGACIAVAAAYLLIQGKKKDQVSGKMADLELQQLGLSIRTTSDKKVSLDHCSLDGSLQGQATNSAATPRKMPFENYTMDELKKATDDFSSCNLIEGSVFHGRLNGKNLVIKRTKTETLSKIEFGLLRDATHRHHPNIVKVIGTCSADGPDSFLVFEYAKNGSLKDWLHGGKAMKSHHIASCYVFLNWNQRLRICLDVATALHYMHQIMIPSYIHGNIKSRNIFLDDEFNAKVGNFGLKRCGHDTEDQKTWSKGYLAPEYVHHGEISPSMDIFAYGVVLLEVLSGEKPITCGNKKGEEGIWLSEKIKFILESEDAEELREWMDKALGEDYSFDGAVKLAYIARACVEEEPTLRPAAGEIVEVVARLVAQLPYGEEFSVCESSSQPLVLG